MKLIALAPISYDGTAVAEGAAFEADKATAAQLIAAGAAVPATKAAALPVIES